MKLNGISSVLTMTVDLVETVQPGYPKRKAVVISEADILISEYEQVRLNQYANAANDILSSFYVTERVDETLDLI